MMREDLINAGRLLFSRDAAFRLDALIKEAPNLRTVRIPELGHIVKERPLQIFAEAGQHALYGFNRDQQIVGIQYRMHHDADWSAKAEFEAARPMLQKLCQGSWRHHHDWARFDRLEAESCTWKPSYFESVTLRREQLNLRGRQQMVSITRHFKQPSAASSVHPNLSDLFVD